MKLPSRSPAETETVGYKIGTMLSAGMVVKLYGDLGAGKTTMVKGIARAFGIHADDVISPSFTIVTEYESTPRFFHMDLYRITTETDLDSTGIWDCVADDTVCVIEWPELADSDLPGNALTVRILHKGSDERDIEIEGVNEKDWNNLQA